MWIDLYIDDKPAKSWVFGNCPVEEFTEAAHKQRGQYVNGKIAHCLVDASDLICDCRKYRFYLRIKSALSCRLLPGEEITKEPHHEEWQELFIEENASNMTAQQLADGVGLRLNWVYRYCKRKGIKFLKASKSIYHHAETVF